MTARSGSPSLARMLAALMFVPLMMPRPAQAWPASVIAGVDATGAGDDQGTRTALVAGVARLGGFQAMLAGLRFDDRVVGEGSGVTAGLGVPLAPMVSLQLQGSRFLGDQDYSAWRTRVGPELDLPRGASALIAWTHDQNSFGVRADGGVFESSTPLIAGLALRANAAAARTDAGVMSAAGSGGLSWSGIPHLLLIGELGRARNGGSTFGQSGPPPFLGLIPRGGGSSTTQPDVTTSTFLFGVRASLP